MNTEPRETTYEERATRGECPVRGAQDGEWCHAEVGIQLGATVGGNRLRTGDGAHLARRARHRPPDCRDRRTANPSIARLRRAPLHVTVWNGQGLGRGEIPTILQA